MNFVQICSIFSKFRGFFWTKKTKKSCVHEIESRIKNMRLKKCSKKGKKVILTKVNHVPTHKNTNFIFDGFPYMSQPFPQRRFQVCAPVKVLTYLQYLFRNLTFNVDGLHMPFSKFNVHMISLKLNLQRLKRPRIH